MEEVRVQSRLAENILSNKPKDAEWHTNMKSIKNMKLQWLFKFRTVVDIDLSYNYFCEKYVTDIQLLDMLINQVAIKAKCKSSVEDAATYNVCIVLSHQEILDAFCQCPEGPSAVCCHVGALYYAVLDIKVRGEVPIQKSSTDYLCRSAIPSKTCKSRVIKKRVPRTKPQQRKIEHSTTGKIVFKNTMYDPRGPDDPKGPSQEERRQKLCDDLILRCPDNPFVIEALCERRMKAKERLAEQTVAEPMETELMIPSTTT